MSKVILACLLVLLAGCATKQYTRSNISGEITLTCAYNTLEEMDGITKVWLSYDRLPLRPIIARSHLLGEDGIEFEGGGFFGFVSIKSTMPPPGRLYADVIVYSDDGFLYRNFAIWGPREKLLRIQQIKEQIKESLLDSCNK